MVRQKTTLLISLALWLLCVIAHAFAEDSVSINQSGSAIENVSGPVYAPSSNTINTAIIGNDNTVDNSHISYLRREINANKSDISTYINKNNTYNVGVTVTLSLSIVINLYLLHRSRKQGEAIKKLLHHYQASFVEKD